MEKIKLILTTAFACAFLAGCASKRAVVDSTWTQKPSKVKIVFTEPIVANPDDLADDLPDYVHNFSDWYKAQIEANLGDYSNGVLYAVEKVSRDEITSEVSYVNGINIKTPKMKTMDESADVYLVMDDLWIGRTESETTCTPGAGGFGAGGMGMGMTCSTQKDFTGKGNYAYFDVKTGKKLGYGDFESKASYTFAVSQSDWIDVVKKTVKTMFKDTPIAQ